MNLPIDATLLMPQRSIPTPSQGGDKASREASLQRNCDTFEAIFTQQMFKAMRATVEDGGLLQKSQADEIFAGLMDQQVAQELANTGRLGISELLFAQLQHKD